MARTNFAVSTRGGIAIAVDLSVAVGGAIHLVLVLVAVAVQERRLILRLMSRLKRGSSCTVEIQRVARLAELPRGVNVVAGVRRTYHLLARGVQLSLAHVLVQLACFEFSNDNLCLDNPLLLFPCSAAIHSAIHLHIPPLSSRAIHSESRISCNLTTTHVQCKILQLETAVTRVDAILSPNSFRSLLLETLSSPLFKLLD